MKPVRMPGALFSLAVLLVLLAPQPVYPREWLVPSEVSTIQAAIDSAKTGDIVLLASGVYTGIGNRDITYGGKAITVKSESGNPMDCVIDCEGSQSAPHRGFIFSDEEGNGSVLEGITIRNGYSDHQGGGILCRESPTIRNCMFSGNFASTYGAGIACSNRAMPIISGCLFVGNEAQTWEGGGIALISDCDVAVTSCSFWGNVGIAIWCLCSSPNIRQTIISECTGSVECFPGGIDDSRPVLSCCDLYGNSRGDWTDCIAAQLGVRGNFSACPSFCGADACDFRLCDESPCLPGNHPAGYDCGLIGARGLGCACGPSNTVPSTWGSIKAVHR